MDNPITQESELKVGDQVILTEKTFSSEERTVTATIVAVRWILGKLSYVIEADGGKRKVVGPSQVRKE